MVRTAALGTIIALSAAGAAAGDIIDFRFLGNAGEGLLPGNSVGPGTPVNPGGPSSAFGGEAGLGLVYDTDTNILSFDFEFQNLTGGLDDVASGIHLHVVPGSTDPFNDTGGIAFNLNSGTDPNVTLFTPLVPTDGSATGARVAGTAIFTDAQEAALFAGNYYLNIHSNGFAGGELRGNLVPAPATAGALALGALAATRRRR